MFKKIIIILISINIIISKNCEDFKLYKIYKKTYNLKGINSLDKKNFKFTFCSILNECKKEYNFIYNQSDKYCLEDFKYNRHLDFEESKSPDQNNIISLDNLRIYYTTKEKYYYKINKKKEIYTIYLPKFSKPNFAFIYFISIIKIILGLYVCFLGIKFYETCIFILNFLFSFELFRFGLIYFLGEDDFYQKHIIIILFLISILIGMITSLIAFKFNKFNLLLNIWFLSLTITKFLFYFIWKLTPYLKYYIFLVYLIVWIINYIISLYLCKKNLKFAIMFFTSFIGSSFFFYNLRKLLFFNDSVIFIFRNINYNQNEKIFDFELIITLLNIVMLSIMGLIIQINFKNIVLKVKFNDYKID